MKELQWQANKNIIALAGDKLDLVVDQPISAQSQQLMLKHMQRKLAYTFSKIQQRYPRMFESFSQQLQRGFYWIRLDQEIQGLVHS